MSTSCKKCPNGSFVAFDKAPGTQAQDCKTCPLGRIYIDGITLRFFSSLSLGSGGVWEGGGVGGCGLAQGRFCSHFRVKLHKT